MDDGDFEDDFNKELATVLLRVLTARAVKLLIEQLQELDVIVGTWFMAFCGEHPPTEGNAFVLKLLAEKGTSIVDHTQRPPVTHVVDPQARDADARSRCVFLARFRKYMFINSTRLLARTLRPNPLTLQPNPRPRSRSRTACC